MTISSLIILGTGCSRSVWCRPLFWIRKDPRLGQVPTSEGWDRFGTGIWYRHAACTKLVTCPTGTGKDQLEKRPVPYPMDRWYLYSGGCPCPRDRLSTHTGGLSLSESRDRLYAHDGTCPNPSCPNLYHKVGLQGLGNLQNADLRVREDGNRFWIMDYFG